MMDKFEYGDLNRFLVSLGLALMLGSVAALWLFLKEPFDLGFTVEQLGKLTPVAKEIIEQRQRSTGLILGVLPIVAGVGFVIGAAVSVIGIYRWYPSQRREERKQVLDLQNLEAMSNGEVSDNARAEVAGQAGTITEGAARSIDTAATEYLQTEAKLLDALADRLRTQFEIIPHQKIGARVIDSLIQSKADPNLNYLLEFKTLAPGASFRYISDAYRQCSEAASATTLSTKKHYVPLVIAVTSDLSPNLIERAGELVRETADNPTAFGTALIRLISPKRVATLSAKDCEAILDVNRRFLVLGDSTQAL